MNELLTMLSKSPLFQNADPILLDLALDMGKVVQLKEKQIIIRKGQPNDSLLILLTARVGINLDQKRTYVELGALDCVGEMSMVDGSVSSADVEVVQAGEALILPRKAVWNLVSHSHPLAFNLLKILTHRLRQGNSLIVNEAEKAQEFASVALTDSLTGLYNRHWMASGYQRVLTRLEKTSRDSSLLFLDIDFFKKVNDTHGHKIGDEVLIRVAEIIQMVVRPTDLSVRYAGDEFTVLLPKAYLDQAFLVAGRLVEAAAKDSILRTLVPGGVTLSVGVASTRESKTLAELLEAGDEALYRAKEFGRNRASL